MVKTDLREDRARGKKTGLIQNSSVRIRIILFTYKKAVFSFLAVLPWFLSAV